MAVTPPHFFKKNSFGEKLRGKGAQTCPPGHSYACIMSCCNTDGKKKKHPTNLQSGRFKYEHTRQSSLINSSQLTVRLRAIAQPPSTCNNSLQAGNQRAHRNGRRAEHMWRQREGKVYYLSTGCRRVDIQTLVINSVGQLKQPIAVFGLWGNFFLNQAAQRAAAFLQLNRLMFSKWETMKWSICFPD